MRRVLVCLVSVFGIAFSACTFTIQISNDTNPVNMKGMTGKASGNDGMDPSSQANVALRTASLKGEYLVLRNNHKETVTIVEHSFGLGDSIEASYKSDKTAAPGEEVALGFPGSISDARFSGQGLFYQVKYNAGSATLVWDSRYHE